jgi:hypothetical protein
MSFDKFRWLKLLLADSRFTEKEQVLGIVVCVWFTRSDGTGWVVELDDIAEKVAQGMCHNRMTIGLKKLVGYGYLQETSRSLGGRGLKAKRSHNLSKPYPVLDGVNGKPYPAADGVLAETLSSTEQNPIQDGIKPYPERDDKTTSDLPGQPPTGTSSGTPSGTASVDEPSDEHRNGSSHATAPNGFDPPKRTCPLHPHSDPCPTCASDRKAIEAWKREGPQRLSALQDQINRLGGCLHRSRDADECRELGEEIRALRAERKRWVTVLQAEGVPTV